MKNLAKIIFALLTILAATFLAFTPPASAQEAQSFGGTLSVRLDPETREKTPVGDVTVSVLRDGAEVGSTTSDEAGVFLVDVPEPGTYTIAIDPETLPDEAVLSNPTATERTLEVKEGQAKKVAFPLEAADATDTAVADFLGKVARLTAVSYTHLTLPTTPYV